MIDTTTKLDEVIALVRSSGFITARAAREQGIKPYVLQRLTERGILTHVSRGVYELTNADFTEHHTLVEACLRVPQGVICLLSALRFHDLTTQLPHQVWMALDRRAWSPRITYPPVRFVSMSGPAYALGIETPVIEGQQIRVYSVAKTVADCFKYRNKIGLDIALEALTDAWRGRRVTMDELWKAAKVDRVSEIMRPYLEGVQV